jgi:hypothetical protein
MSTRANIHFTHGNSILANVYKHSDGYPEGMLPVLEKFFRAVEEQASDTRFSDPEYLAAKFVVYLAHEYPSPGEPLAFLGVGVVTRDAGDGEYIYTVDCGHLDAHGRPTVTHREV